MPSEPVHFEPCSEHVGVTVSGVDLSRPVEPELAASLRSAVFERGLLVIPGQALGADDLVRAGRMFGALARYPFVAGLASHPDIVEVYKSAEATANFGGVWHSDTTYLAQPPSVTVLSARELPPSGGDTLFASAQAAFEALPAGEQERLRRLRVVNSSAKGAAASGRSAQAPGAGQQVDVREAEHPLVRVHPETGREALFVNRGHSVRLLGVDEADGVPLLERLITHATSSAWTYRHRWTAGCVIAWDNRVVQHNAVNDYHGHARRMWRVTVQ